MQTVYFYGHSDDLVEVEGSVAGCAEYDVLDDMLASAGRYGAHARFAIIHEGVEKLHVIAVYADNGTWTFMPVLVDDENRLIDDWVISVQHSSQCDHSMSLTISVPDDASVIRLPAQ